MYVKRYRDRKKIYLPEVSLCHLEGHSCAGCCINLYEQDDVIREFLKNNTEYFEKFFPDLKTVNPTFLEEYLWELEKINRKEPTFLMYNCYFAGFIDREEEKAGCLVHPVRLDGIELRDLLSVNCVPHGKCYRDILWHEISEVNKKKFISLVENNNFIEYSRNIYRLIPDLYGSSELKKSPYYRIAVKDHGIQAGSKLKKNLDLISEFYSTEKENKSYEDMFFKYGEMYLEKILRDISDKYKLLLNIIELPEYLIRDGDEYINGEHLYILFAPSSLNTNKTVILGTGYSNSKEKLGCNDIKTAKTVSFLLTCISKLHRRRDINYLWLFTGGEKDIILPLRGSFYFRDLLKKGFNTGSNVITTGDILIYMYFDGILINNIHSALDYHIPCSQSCLTEIEEYYKDFLYSNIDVSFAEASGIKAVEHYFIDLFDFKDFSLTDNMLEETIKKMLKEKTPLNGEKINEICRKIFNNLLWLTEDEKNKYIEKMEENIIKKIYKPAGEINFLKIEENLVKLGILMKSSDKRRNLRFVVNTHKDYTENFFHFLVNNGFIRDKDQYGINKGFYPFASCGIPCVCISGSEEKSCDGDCNKFLDSLYDFLLNMEYCRENNFTKIIDSDNIV